MKPHSTFTLTEDRCFGSRFQWRLADGQLQFAGTDDMRYFHPFRNQFMPCVSFDDAQLLQFRHALDLIDVWNWRPNYDPKDVGCRIDDGFEWEFTASFGDDRCSSRGTNAFPSLNDVQTTIASENSGRYGVLIGTFCDIFRISIPGYNC